MSSFFTDHWTKHLFLAHTHLELQLNELALEIYFGLQAGGLQVMFVRFLMSWFTPCNKINMFTIIVYEGILSKLASMKHVLDLGLDLHSCPSGDRVSQHERGWPGRPVLSTTFRNRSLQVRKQHFIRPRSKIRLCLQSSSLTTKMLESGHFGSL